MSTKNRRLYFWFCTRCVYRNEKKRGKSKDGYGVSFCEEKAEYLSIFQYCDSGKFTQKAIKEGIPWELGRSVGAE